MASEKRLDCVILGLLSHEELTGYEIKQRMDTTLKYFWGASFGSIYPTLGQLVEQGLATRRDESDGGRQRLVYTITEAGRRHLKTWLGQPVVKDELRYETLLKLFFGQEGGAEQALEHIESFECRIAAELPRLEQAHQTLSTAPDPEAHRYYLLTVEFGIKTYTAYMEWCKEAKSMLKGE